MNSPRASAARYVTIVALVSSAAWLTGRATGAAPATYDASACTWTVLADNVPRTHHVLVSMPDIENAVLSFGGSSNLQGSAVMSDTYRLSLGVGSQGSWALLPRSGAAPGPRAWHAAALRERSLGFEMVTYGGYDGVPGVDVQDRPSGSSPVARDESSARPSRASGISAQTHALVPLGGWRQVDADDDEPRSGHAAVYWPAKDWLLAFGGQVDAASVTSETLRLPLDSEVKAWAPLVAAGEAPSARAGHTAVRDPLDQQVILYGGTEDFASGMADAWALLLGGDVPTWTALDPAGEGPAPRYDHAAAFLSGPRLMAVFGGTSDGQSPLGDLQLLDFSTYPPTWLSPAPMPVQPGARLGAAAAAVGDDALVLYGGQTADGVLADAWLLRCPVQPEATDTATQTPTPTATGTPTLPTPATPAQTQTPPPTDTPGAPPQELALHGLVYDAAGGRQRPIWGATVRVPPCHTAHQPFNGGSAPDGSYRVILPGSYFSYGCTVSIEVSADGWVTSTTEVLYDDLVADPERDFGLEPVTAPTPTSTQGPVSIQLHGLVYDATAGPSRPIAGALVRVPACQTPHQPFAGQSGADGRYVVVLPTPYFLPGCTVHIEVSAAGYETASLDVAYEELVAVPERDFALSAVETTGGSIHLPYLGRGSG